MEACKFCEEELKKGKTFCGKCGNRLAAVEDKGRLYPQTRLAPEFDASIHENSNNDNSQHIQTINTTNVTNIHGPSEQGAICPICLIYNKDLSRTFYCKWCTRSDIHNHHKELGPRGPYCGDPKCDGSKPLTSTTPGPIHQSEQYNQLSGTASPQILQDERATIISPLKFKSLTTDSEKSLEGNLYDEFFNYLLIKKRKLNDIHDGKTKLNGYQHIYSVQPLGLKGLYYTFRLKKDCGEVYLEIIRNNEPESNKLYDYLLAHKIEILNVFGVKGLDILPPKGAKSAIYVKCKEPCIGNYRDCSQWERMTDEMIKDMRNLEDATIPWLQRYDRGEQ